MPGSLAEVFVQERGLSAGNAHRSAMVWSSQLLIEPEEARRWLRSGVGMYDSHLVDQLRSYGVTPELMATVVRGETMWDRMRLFGYGPDKVACTLRLAGLLKRSA